ncbi:hypothetical protein EK904_001836 [Melospiza melodia maxima]|nr:hypothetical protein EK904_001836 [Melospiza melodia maxima]
MAAEVEQGPAVGVAAVGGIALLQHLAHGVDIAGGHGSLDLQLFLQLRVPPAVVLLSRCALEPPEGDGSCHQQHLPSTAGGTGSHQDSDMSDVVPATDDLSRSFANMSSSFCPREVMLLQLTLIKMMVAKAESQEIELHTRQKYCEIFVLLLKEAKIDSKLIHLLGSDDRLLSHMASQSLASLVYFQLKEEDAVNVPWLRFSLAALLGLPGSAGVPACLWTLAAILKETLKDAPAARAGTGGAARRSRSPGVPRECFGSRTPLPSLIQGVVNLTWLNQIPLSGKSSYFGSSETAPGHDSQGASDQTVLRALSLVVLKALEFKIHNSATEAEIKGDFESSMSQLLMFWRSHGKPSPHSHPAGHHCEWLSLVFMEQDDDMWEAAKALLLIYLKLDRLQCDVPGNLSHKEEESWQFLVHAETCFLEYLVRYLKLLGMEWPHFVEVCNHFDTRPSTLHAAGSVKQSCVTGASLQSAVCSAEPRSAMASAPHNCPVFTARHGDNEAAEWSQSDSLTSADSASLLGSLQSLVNYDSSEDSEVESDGKECLVNTKQLHSNNEGEARRRETSCSCRDDDRNSRTSEVSPPKLKGSSASSCWTPLKKLVL